MSPETGMGTVLARVRRATERFPDHVALQTATQRFSYAHLAAATDGMAGALRADGLQRGERVGLVLGNSADFVLAYLAALKAGAVVVPMNPMAPMATTAALLQDCTPSALFLERRHRDELPTLAAQLGSLRRAYVEGWGDGPRRQGGVSVSAIAALAQGPGTGNTPLPDDSDLAAIVYTSGTTGVPKGVTLSHANMAAIVDAAQSLLEVTPHDRVGQLNPFFHLYGMREIDHAFCVGATLVVPGDPRFPARVIEQFHATQVTGFAAVPSGIVIVLDRYRAQLAACADHVRYVAIGTAMSSTSLLADLRGTLPRTRVIVTYGLSENSRVCWREVADPAREPVEGVVGRPYAGVQIRLLDVVDGLGQVAVKSPMTMQGYWNRQEATRATFTEDGWLLSPDLGEMDADGSVRLLGRIDDIINSGGQKVSPEEVEWVLGRHPAVAAVAVIAAPDPAGVLGQIARALVVRRMGEDVSAETLTQHAAAALEPHKVPRQIVFVDELPRAVLGKLQRRRLREAREPASRQ
jgi:long-chain acyl-CoA synthetase